MNRKLLYSLFLLIVCSAIGLAQLKDTVTFRVKMHVKMQEGKFKPSLGDTVRVVGSFNSWSATDTTVRMSTGGTDSVYSVTVKLDSAVVHDDTVYFKFLKSPRGGDWESVSNRIYKLVNGTHSTPIYFFDDDSTVNALVSVTFRVNMAIKFRELTFQPSLNDTVRVVGSFQSWNTKDTTVRLTKGASDSIYSGAYTVNEGDKLFYKYYKTSRGGLDWESNQATSSTNREYTVPLGGGPIPVVWFDNDSVYNAAVQASFLWETDMSAYITLGWFNVQKDTIEVRGGFTGWSGTKMAPNLLYPNIWQYNLQNFIAPIGDAMSFKYYMRFDSAAAVARFPGLIWAGSTSNRDGFAYEHPAERGDGNNLYSVLNAATQTPQRSYFAGIHPFGLFGATDSTTVTLKVNMGPATRYSNPFVAATDTVYLVWQDWIWRSAQIKGQGSFPDIKMTRAGATDSNYTATFKVKGKTHYNMQYTYRYKKSDGTTVDQGGGLGGQNPFITRFIRRTAGVWPTTYTASTDNWQKDAPLPGETATYPTDVNEAAGPPLSYSLFQNYPNPFNPTTTIRYTLPIQDKVRLRVYNILGQVVAELVNEVKPAGTHLVSFEANRLATGVYFYKLDAGSFTDVKKMLLLK